jgi:hypothetical protein
MPQTGRALRNSQFEMVAAFSGIHFGLDNWGILLPP